MLGEFVIVAIDRVHISMIINVDCKTINRCEQIKDGCYILKAEDEDLRIIRYLNSLAREERSDFKQLPQIQNNPNSYIIFSETQPVGYLAYTHVPWNKDLVPTIWQIYVVKDKRSMGYGG
ncbi:GNAT family N-acetyltransferase [Methanolobus sp. ZRKC3]|uniref:GNAT family N-acetyltransferase n=1 Tax=Methanolobus sp. ZRKC3 TaxID=3125786 RepID=UPI003254F3CD